MKGEQQPSVGFYVLGKAFGGECCTHAVEHIPLGMRSSGGAEVGDDLKNTAQVLVQAFNDGGFNRGKMVEDGTPGYTGFFGERIRRERLKTACEHEFFCRIHNGDAVLGFTRGAFIYNLLGNTHSYYTKCNIAPSATIFCVSSTIFLHSVHIV